MAITLRSLSPLGPIFGKELRATARRKRTYWLRFGYLGALLLVLLMLYTASMFEMNYGGVARKAQKMAEMGVYFFVAFSFFTLGSMALIGPILTSTAINSERLHKTLPVLLMTPITAWQIVAGKLFSRLLIAFTLIGLSLPVLAVVRLLGGVEIEQMFASLCICATVALTGAAIGLLLSTLMNRAYSVILLSYGIMGVIYGLLPLITGLVVFEWLNFRGRQAETVFFTILGYTNPGLAMFLAVVPEKPPFRVPGWGPMVIGHLAFSALLILLSALILRRMARREAAGAGSSENSAPAALAGPAAAAPLASEGAPAAESPPMIDYAAADLRRAAPARPRVVSDNPVLWREVRRPLMAKRWQRVAATLFVLGCLALIYIALAGGNDLDDPDVQIGFATVFCGLINLLVCVLAGTAIAQEKESDTWTLLLATPVTARSVVIGKLAGLLRRILWPMLLIFAHFLIFSIAGVIHFSAMVIILWLTLTTNFTWLCTGVYYSLRLKTVTFAVILNLLTPIIAYGGVAVLLAIAGAVIERRPEWAEVSLLYAPYAYIATAVEQLNDRNIGFYYPDGRQPYERRFWVPTFGRVSSSEFMLAILLCGLAHIVVSGALLWYTIARFDAIVGRAVQNAPAAENNPARALA